MIVKNESQNRLKTARKLLVRFAWRRSSRISVDVHIRQCGLFMQIDDLSSFVYAPELHRGVKTCSVGWLGNVVPTTGRLSTRELDRLRWLRANDLHDEGDLGYHECEICFDYKDRGEVWIESNGIRYVAPAMILHYCEIHSYLPPERFLHALLGDLA